MLESPRLPYKSRNKARTFNRATNFKILMRNGAKAVNNNGLWLTYSDSEELYYTLRDIF